MSAPAASASRALSPSAKTATRTGLAGAVGQRDGAADVLVGLARVDAQAEVDLDGLVELGGRELLGQGDGLEGGVELGAVDLRRAGAITLAVLLSHGGVSFRGLFGPCGPPTCPLGACAKNGRVVLG